MLSIIKIIFGTGNSNLQTSKQEQPICEGGLAQSRENNNSQDVIVDEAKLQDIDYVRQNFRYLSPSQRVKSIWFTECIMNKSRKNGRPNPNTNT